MKKRIVILEDDEDIREIFSIFLQEEGFEVHLRDLAFEHLADVERLVPDLMIVDLFIENKGEGWEFLYRLKAHPPTVHIPFILCTARHLTREQESATQHLGISILYKPFDLNELHHLVHRLLGLSSFAVEGTMQTQ